MWNHAPLMHQRAGDSFPILGPGDMSNLVAYLFAQRYFYDEGDAARGAKVFETKRCASCHQQAHGFSDLATASAGVNGTTGRHAMRLRWPSRSNAAAPSTTTGIPVRLRKSSQGI